MDLVLATRNKGKVRELTGMIRGTPLELNILSLLDFPDIPAIPEDGATFRANAMYKALAAAKATGKLSMGDDSGLEIDALAGQPGVLSARFAGEKATDSENNEKLLGLLRDIPERQRQARFACCIALANPERVIDVVEGSCPGILVEKERGGAGFGYDPLFQPLEYHRTFAELPPVVKNRISHRAKAMEKALMILEKYLYSPGNDAYR
ncbi:MAG: RdgB/HAM1 family non-canonical purine NTP pyrophosphatase [Candidatus Aureabacteria bacterium]|nr:RdgB/HAM1 family non-canonical purine NTP pyrophosphatase [Candidatus Auribacterota bacterium]